LFYEAIPANALRNRYEGNEVAGFAGTVGDGSLKDFELYLNGRQDVDADIVRVGIKESVTYNQLYS
jgi:hypothetical protein